MKRLHPTIRAAARGELPEWTVAGPARRAHMLRVSELMKSWASELGFSRTKRARWAAAGLLHDALRDEAPRRLRSKLPKRLRDLPDAVVHGPAASERLRREGVEDEALLLAVAFHSLGHPGMGRMGRAICCADFLEPGRTSARAYRDGLLERMPNELDDVLFEIFSGRLDGVRKRGGKMTRWTRDFWKEIKGRASG